MPKRTAFTQETFDQLLQGLVREIESLHPTSDDVEERFYGFVVPSDIRGKIKMALDLYESVTQEQEAVDVLIDTTNHLRAVQISYLRGCMKMRFDRDLDGLIKRGLSQDWINYVNKRLNPLREYAARHVSQIDLATAGKLYKAALDALIRADEELEKTLESRRAAEAKAREEARAAKVEADRLAAIARREAQLAATRQSRKGYTAQFRQVLERIS